MTRVLILVVATLMATIVSMDAVQGWKLLHSGESLATHSINSSKGR